ncbi:hypothetical protein [Clostridium senegalense]|uniref:hypothetical protein n=1 Tax=Clostridium senegalense TaxID=1465809 RepID=UPI00028A29F1|nr:hypothetical protein [Clostridium senegalense]
MNSNKIFISQFKSTDEENIFIIGFTHYCPFHEEDGLNKTEEELLQEGVLINKEDVPEPENREGYRAELLYDKRNNNLVYKYFEINEKDLLHPESVEQKEIRELRQKIEEQEQAILELTSMITGGNANA